MERTVKRTAGGDCRGTRWVGAEGWGAGAIIVLRAQDSVVGCVSRVGRYDERRGRRRRGQASRWTGGRGAADENR